jgi:flagellar assembly protein FliH
MTSSAEPLAAAWLPRLDAWTDPGPGEEAPCADDSGALALPELISDPPPAPAAARTESDHAWERGYAQGLAEGAIRAERVLQPAVEALAAVTTQLDASHTRFARERERDLEGLALAVARSLVQRELRSDPTIVRDLVVRALACVPAGPGVQVRLNPIDHEILASELEALAATDRMGTVQWSADPALERGSFVVEGPQRIVDGRTDVALRDLYERLAS